MKSSKGHLTRQRKTASPPSSASRRKVWCGWGAAVVALLALSLGFWWQQSRPPPLPIVDLRAVEPQVAAAVEQRLNQVRARPKSGAAWGQLGALLWAYDLRPAARQCLARAEQLDPGNPRWPYYRALSLIIATPNQAIPILERTVEICGSTPETPRFRLARLLVEQGRWDQARPHWQALLDSHPDFAPARLLAARDAQHRSEVDQAIALAQACVEDPRTTRAAWLLLSVLHRQKGDGAASVAAAQRAATLPEDQGIADPFEAEASLLRSDPRVLCEQAHPLLAAGQLSEAAALVHRLQQQHPGYAETWLLAGRLAFLRKELSAAESHLQRHIEMNPHSTQGWFQLGSVRLAREQFIDAAAAFERATQLKSDFGPAHYNRGLALGRAGQLREAAGAFHESLRHNPERLESYLFVAELHLRLGERDLAVAVMQQARAINPSDRRLAALERKAHARE